MPVYRYRWEVINQTNLDNRVPGALVLGSQGPIVYKDISAPTSSKSDLDDYMAQWGWVFDSTDPATTPFQQSGVNNTPFAETAPVDVTKAAAAIGVLNTVARADHKHDASTGTPGTVTFGAAAEGAATSLARSDHTHALTAPAAPADVTKAAASAGSAANVAREDHKHDVTTAAPTATGVATASGEGAATTLARSDHTHQSNTAPANVTKAAAAIGTSGEPARADHKHDISTGTPAIGIGGGNAEGTATSLARSDHNHALRETGGPTDLTIAAIPDRSFFKRYGSTVAGFPLPIKTSCVVVSTANITLSAPQTIDGVGVVAGDRVLVTGQSTPADNGIYVVNAGAWTRATDMDASADLIASLMVPISRGTSFQDTVWMLSSDGPFTLGVTALNWKLLTRSPNTIVKEAWFPITSNATIAKGDYATVAVGANAQVQFTVRFPSDLTTILRLICVGIPNGTFTNQDIDITSDYALAGQVFNTNQGSDTTSLYSGTINTLFELSIASIFPGVVANQYGGCTVKHNAIGTTIGYIGIWLEYT